VFAVVLSLQGQLGIGSIKKTKATPEGETQALQLSEGFAGNVC
jgi:hypothetical protein